MIPAINMRRVAGLVFSADNAGNLTCHAAQYLSLCVHHYPVLFNCSLVRVSGFVAVMIHFVVKNLLETIPPVKRDTKVICLFLKCKHHAILLFLLQKYPEFQIVNSTQSDSLVVLTRKLPGLCLPADGK